MSRARDIANFGDGIATADIDDGAVTAAKIGSLPAGSVLQVAQLQLDPSDETTTSTTYQSSAFHLTVQKVESDSRLLVIMSGGLQYVTDFANGVFSTICQESSSSTFTASTTYNSANDPASASQFGMQQVYNNSSINTAPHSKCWLFASSGNEFEAFRAFYRSRSSGKTAFFHEGGAFVTLTVMEIAQ